MAEGLRRANETGQASVELVAGLPALLLTGLVALQLLATGYAVTLADGAAEAGALALAAGRPAAAAAREALPGWARGRGQGGGRGGEGTGRGLPPPPGAALAGK